MRTVRIRYGRLKSLPGYDNVRFEREIELDEGDDEMHAVEALRAEVDEVLGVGEAIVNLSAHLSNLREQANWANRDLAKIRKERDAMAKQLRQMTDFVDLARKAGLKVPEALQDDITF